MSDNTRTRVKAEFPRPQGEPAKPRIKAGSPEARVALTPSPEAPLPEAEAKATTTKSKPKSK